MNPEPWMASLESKQCFAVQTVFTLALTGKMDFGVFFGTPFFNGALNG